MRHRRSPDAGPASKALALVPLALLSAAWTTNLAGVGAAIETANQGPVTLPDGTVPPTEAYKRPASYARPGTVAPAFRPGVVTLLSRRLRPTASPRLRCRPTNVRRP